MSQLSTVEVISVLDTVMVRVLLLMADLQAGVRARFDRLRRAPEAGYNTEATVVTAILAAAAITIVGIIVKKITDRANGINLNPPAP